MELEFDWMACRIRNSTDEEHEGNIWMKYLRLRRKLVVVGEEFL